MWISLQKCKTFQVQLVQGIYSSLCYQFFVENLGLVVISHCFHHPNNLDTTDMVHDSTPSLQPSSSDQQQRLIKQEDHHHHGCHHFGLPHLLVAICCHPQYEEPINIHVHIHISYLVSMENISADLRRTLLGSVVILAYSNR